MNEVEKGHLNRGQNLTGFEDVAGDFKFDVVESDGQMRAAAFAEVQRLSQLHGKITSKDLANGFNYAGRRIPFVNPQRGIFKPKEMRRLLSIRTVYPRAGSRIWYDDQRDVHRQVFEEDEAIDYSFMGGDPNAAENRWLQDAGDLQIPFIYFLGTAPGCYDAVLPAFVIGIDTRALKARIAFSTPSSDFRAPDSAAERRYALRAVKQRLHQSAFREMVIEAYRGRCAISGLPEPLLLDAAHIVDDKDEKLGQPLVTNGIPLSKIHHAAFDAQLIGIDADSKVHVSEKLLSLNDGPQLEALRQFHGRTLLAPRREIDRPDRERLDFRFQKFLAAA